MTRTPPPFARPSPPTTEAEALAEVNVLLRMRPAPPQAAIDRAFDRLEAIREAGRGIPLPPRVPVALSLPIPAETGPDAKAETWGARFAEVEPDLFAGQAIRRPGRGCD